jgi:PAS domain-containing protein
MKTRYPRVRNSGDAGAQIILWRFEQFRCEFWIEKGRGYLALFEGDLRKRTVEGTRALLREQSERWRAAVSDERRTPSPERDPALLWTDIAGRILEASKPAAELLHVSARSLLGRDAYQFVGRNRLDVMQAAQRILFRKKASEHLDAWIYPRNSRPIHTTLELQASEHPRDKGPAVLWMVNAELQS